MLETLFSGLKSSSALKRLCEKLRDVRIIINLFGWRRRAMFRTKQERSKIRLDEASVDDGRRRWDMKGSSGVESEDDKVQASVWVKESIKAKSANMQLMNCKLQAACYFLLTSAICILLLVRVSACLYSLRFSCYHNSPVELFDWLKE